MPLGEEVNVIQTEHPVQDMVKAQKPSKRVTKGQPGSRDQSRVTASLLNGTQEAELYQHIS